MNVNEQDIYVWPNPNFPFKCILNTDKQRVFVLSDLTHNYEWLKIAKIQSKDLFFVAFGWFFSEYLATHAEWMFQKLRLNKGQFYLMYNSQEEKTHGDKFGFEGSIINNNAWLDERAYSIYKNKKIYDALYIARPVTFKRHFLATKIPNLALLAGDLCHGNEKAALPKHKNNAFQFLNKQQISEICGESHCGVILSKEEGACFASSEYLLCGIPVVSTLSKGGRDIWYNSENSLICEATDVDVANSVGLAKSIKWDSNEIRRNHIKLMYKFRRKFKNILNEKTSGLADSMDLTLNYHGINWYCNPDSQCTPNEKEVLSYFR